MAEGIFKKLIGKNIRAICMSFNLEIDGYTVVFVMRSMCARQTSGKVAK